MEFKGTKGYWEVSKEPHYYNGNKAYEINYGTDRECVAEIVHDLSDAKLIACAPQMFELIDEMKEALIWYQDNCVPVERSRNNDEIFFNLGMNLRQSSEDLILKATI